MRCAEVCASACASLRVCVCVCVAVCARVHACLCGRVWFSSHLIAAKVVGGLVEHRVLAVAGRAHHELPNGLESGSM